MLPFQDSRFSEWLRRITGQKGPVQLQALPDVMPVMLASQGGAEESYLRGERLMAGHVNMAAVAAQFGTIALEPQDPGWLAVVEHIDIISANNVLANIVPEVFLGGSGSSVVPRDSRVGRGDATRSHFSLTGATNAVATVAALSSTITIVGGVHDASPPWVLAPGGRLVLETGSVNLDIRATLWWREVPLPPAFR